MTSPRPLVAGCILTALLFGACSKSPVDRVVETANAAGQKLMQPLVPSDASGQAERMIRLVVADKPECESFRARMREVGKYSPFEATTQKQFILVQQDACKANCCK
jgi:predicted lactoylglutathione lyase